ncbi:MAG: VWA domain-containing protein [Sphingobacteriales bacterium]|nr:MAG: VWA domain-containing protein [Sphingobacteriales bacterium]
MQSKPIFAVLLIIFTLLFTAGCTNKRTQQENYRSDYLINQQQTNYKPQPVELYDKNNAKLTVPAQSERKLYKGISINEHDNSVLRDAVPSSGKENEDEEFNTEDYNYLPENDFNNVVESPLSTFSIDVDRASYSNIRRYLNEGIMPPADAVRIEEMINYFTYSYPQPNGNDPFSMKIEIGECPWNSGNYLALVGIQGKKIDMTDLPPNRLTFLIDVSGSMEQVNKIVLLKQAFSLLVEQLRPQDMVAMVVYAGAAGVVLEPTPGNQKEVILSALDQLKAGGSTAGGEGIQLAYKIAKQQFKTGSNNRVILATDGDFNVGASSDGELTRIIEENRKSGVYLTTLGFGMGNYKDSKLELLADKGNGNYAYIDNIAEARKVLVTELGATLLTIAKDVKIQVEFNPARIAKYRLIGYENRILAARDFNDDTKDAGELGAGHTVTALYELTPTKSNEPVTAEVDPLKYQQAEIKPSALNSNELMTVKLRYKPPQQDQSLLIERSVNTTGVGQYSDNFTFAASVASFGMLLRQSKYAGTASYDSVLEMAKQGQGSDSEGYRKEFIELVLKAKALQK